LENTIKDVDVKKLREVISHMPDDMLVGLEANGITGMEFYTFQVLIPNIETNHLVFKA